MRRSARQIVVASLSESHRCEAELSRSTQNRTVAVDDTEFVAAPTKKIKKSKKRLAPTKSRFMLRASPGVIFCFSNEKHLAEATGILPAGNNSTKGAIATPLGLRQRQTRRKPGTQSYEASVRVRNLTSAMPVEPPKQTRGSNANGDRSARYTHHRSRCLRAPRNYGVLRWGFGTRSFGDERSRQAS